MTLVEQTHCPYCSCEITKDFDKENRLFGSTIKCESMLCKKEFVVNCAHIFEKGSDLSGSTSVREIIRPKDMVELEEGQTMLTEFV